MAKHVVLAGKSTLEPFASRPAVDALTELIWNALDAEADKVVVAFERGSLGDDGPEHLTRLVIEDNGHGIDPTTAVDRFKSLGDSWKAGQAGRSLNGKRVLHGRHGRGRFFAYSLGHVVTWTSVWNLGGDSRVEFRLEGRRRAMNEISDTEPKPTDKPTGTTVDIRVEQGHTLSALMDDDLGNRLSARLAPHLLGNPDIEVRVDGTLLDPSPLIATREVDVMLDDVPVDDLRGFEVPTLRIIEWNDRVNGEMPSLVLCNAGGAALLELDSKKRQAVKATGYLLWSGFEENHADLVAADTFFGSILDSARRRIADHVSRRIGELSGTIVQQLVEEGSYPYPSTPPDDPLDRAEQQIYDMVLVAARSAIGNTKRERRLTARLMQIAVQERTNDVDDIIDSVLGLPPETKEILRDLLRDTTLSSIVKASNEVRSRIELVVGLSRLLYGPDTASQMREVDQLHPLVRDQEWLFGEDWRLARSETTLTNVLRQVLPDDVTLEEDFDAGGGQVLRSDGTTGRVDLLFQRTWRGPDAIPHRLVVELKRPSTKLSPTHLEQVRSYARALDKHQGVTKGKWTYWLVGTAFDDDLLGDADSRDREWGHVDAKDHYDIYIARWSDLIDRAQMRLDFFKSQLSLEITQDDAARRLRARHGDIIPEITP